MPNACLGHFGTAVLTGFSNNPSRNVRNNEKCIIFAAENPEMEKDCSALKEEISAKETELSQLHMDKNSMQKLIQMMRDSENIQEHVERIRSAATGGPEPTEKDWGRFYQTIERLFPEFDAAIRSRMRRLSDSQIRTCYLMKIGLNNSEIMRLQKLPRQTVWNRVKRIQEEFGPEFFAR